MNEEIFILSTVHETILGKFSPRVALVPQLLRWITEHKHLHLLYALDWNDENFHCFIFCYTSQES